MQHNSAGFAVGSRSGLRLSLQVGEHVCVSPRIFLVEYSIHKNVFYQKDAHVVTMGCTNVVHFRRIFAKM